MKSENFPIFILVKEFLKFFVMLWTYALILDIKAFPFLNALKKTKSS